MLTLRTALLASILAGVAAAPAAGQLDCGSMDECSATKFAGTRFHQELATAGVNALLGGFTAAAFRLVRGEPVADAISDAFWKGAVGGGLAYAGKRVAVERFYGAGLAGRELASLGASIVRNASADRGLLEELVLPVGPIRLYVSSDGVSPRLDLGTLVASGIFMATYGARFDPAASLSSGALVFRGDSPMPGLTSAGATVVWSDMPDHEGPRLMAHERVHVLQYDQVFLFWGEELERWAARETSGKLGDSGLMNHLDLGFTALGIRTGLAMALDYRARPWESEAYFLAQRVYPVEGSL